MVSALAGDGIGVFLVKNISVSPAAPAVGRRNTRYAGVPNICYPTREREFLRL